MSPYEENLNIDLTTLRGGPCFGNGVGPSDRSVPLNRRQYIKTQLLVEVTNKEERKKENIWLGEEISSMHFILSILLAIYYYLFFVL